MKVLSWQGGASFLFWYVREGFIMDEVWLKSGRINRSLIGRCCSGRWERHSKKWELCAKTGERRTVCCLRNFSSSPWLKHTVCAGC